MPEIIMPDGQRLDITAPTPYEQQMLQLLTGVTRLLDILVRLECGVLKRADLKRDILETEAAIRAMQEQQVPTAEESLAAAEAAAE